MAWGSLVFNPAARGSAHEEFHWCSATVSWKASLGSIVSRVRRARQALAGRRHAQGVHRPVGVGRDQVAPVRRERERPDAAAEGPGAKHLYPTRVGGVVPQSYGVVLGTSRRERPRRGERQAVDVAGVTLPGLLLPGFQVPEVYGGLRG